MGSVSFLLVVVIITALAFDFTNGFHDTANSMATSIATGALSPRVAVTVAGVLNLAGAFLSTEVAKTISNGIVDDGRVSLAMIFAGLVGAILWNLITWLAGLPSSSSHALIGGLIGAVWVGAGGSAVRFAEIFEKVVIPAVASPLVACVVATLATYLAYVITRRVAGGAVRKGFRAGQVGSASLVALAHGTNDAQKTMGVITLSLISAGVLGHGTGPPWWVVLSAGLAISVGTYAGGWRIIRTMGRGLTDIQTPQGFAAETSATAVILASSHMGFALSTTQVCTGSILGAGLGRKLAQVRWGIAGRIAVSWLLTLPAAAAVGGVAAWVADRGDTGVALVASIAVVAAAGFYALSRRRPVNSGNVNKLPAAERPEHPVRPAA
ncbi:inorganic phosphate transporter [Streptomyces botrytidirepellens]|uniref:Phosphate transporter n=1 Tax=Streptomyces botrytidirepellens TaxID=2486417 RepID=A0A3M8VJU8_9ACTN|nr:inorganic phosphate transporter [Streptomyces botrytidirepellens]RNG17890.1 inorganic phosphate transporter [Streptomyces botrytidirepellens]